MTMPITSAFRDFAAAIVARNDADLCEYGPEEQIARAVSALERFARFTHLRPAESGHMIDLAGFGSAPVHFIGAKNKYLLISEVAEALGMPIWDACKWAEKQHLWSLQDQRENDEENGILGWECLDDYCDLKLWFIADNPEAEPDAGGRRHSDYGDWLISDDRLLMFIAESPWGKEFMANMSDLFAHGMKKFFTGGPLGDTPVYRQDGKQALHDDGTPMTANDLWHTDLTEEEARRKASRGPNIPLEETEGDE